MANTLTITGFVAQEPELRFTQSGKAVLNFSVPENHGRKDQNGQWEQTGTTWRAVALWGDDAEYAAENLHKGDLVQITGREELQEFQRNDGTNGSKLAFNAFQVAKVLKAPRQSQGQGGQRQGWGNTRNAPQRPAQGQQADPWAGGQQQAADWGNPIHDQEPPF